MILSTEHLAAIGAALCIAFMIVATQTAYALKTVQLLQLTGLMVGSWFIAETIEIKQRCAQ